MAPKTTLKLAAVQMTSTPDWEKNLKTAENFIKKAASKNVDLIAFPEMFSFLGENRSSLLSYTNQSSLQTLQWLKRKAKEYKIWIHGGSIAFPQRNSKKVRNRSFLINSKGISLGHYDKVHLFDAKVSGDRSYQESNTYQAGRQIKAIPSPWGKLGMSICYDLRFPELFRKLTLKGAKIIFLPSAFSQKTGVAHWDALTKARAIENQVFIVASSQYGNHYPGRKTYGHTRIVDPWGNILSEKKSGLGMVISSLNLKKQNQIQKHMPVLKHIELI